MRLSHAIALSLVVHLAAVWGISARQIYPDTQSFRRSQPSPPELRVTFPPRRVAEADSHDHIVAQPLQRRAEDEFLGASEVDQRAVPLRLKPLVIPERAYQERRKGKVRLRAFIDEGGRVRQVVILSSEPEGVFEQAAIEAVAGTVFLPARRKGLPVKTYKNLEIDIDPYESIRVP